MVKYRVTLKREAEITFSVILSKILRSPTNPYIPRTSYDLTSYDRPFEVVQISIPKSLGLKG